MLFYINPHTHVPQKVADEVVFRRFQGKELEFFQSNLTDPPKIFDAHLSIQRSGFVSKFLNRIYPII